MTFSFGNVKIALFEGDRSKFKINYTIDLDIAEVYLKEND